MPVSLFQRDPTGIKLLPGSTNLLLLFKQGFEKDERIGFNQNIYHYIESLLWPPIHSCSLNPTRSKI
jgi:hypothetical protein